MVSVDMNGFLHVIGETLIPIDVQKLKYILTDSLTGKF